MNSVKIKLNNEVTLSFLSKNDSSEFTSFNYIDIFLEQKSNNILLYQNDYFQHAFESITESFKQLLKGNLVFPTNLDFDKGILYYNELYIASFDDNAPLFNMNFPKTDPTEKVSWVLSTNSGYQTFLYAHQDNYYLEISKSYELILDENENMEPNAFKAWEKEFSIDYRFKLDKVDIENFLVELNNTFQK